MPFHVRVDFKPCLLMHKVFNDLAPVNLKHTHTHTHPPTPNTHTHTHTTHTHTHTGHHPRHTIQEEITEDKWRQITMWSLHYVISIMKENVSDGR